MKNRKRFMHVMEKDAMVHSRVNRMTANKNWVDIESVLRGQTNVLSRCQQDNGKSDLMGMTHQAGILDSRAGFLNSRRIEDEYTKPSFNAVWLD